MGTNTENAIRIFGITIRIYSNIGFGRLCLSCFGRSFFCLDTGTVYDQVEVRKVWSWVSINYLELGSLYLVNYFLTTCNSRRRSGICNFELLFFTIAVQQTAKFQISFT